jgi:hypothetical protein
MAGLLRATPVRQAMYGDGESSLGGTTKDGSRQHFVKSALKTPLKTLPRRGPPRPRCPTRHQPTELPYCSKLAHFHLSGAKALSVPSAMLREKLRRLLGLFLELLGLLASGDACFVRSASSATSPKSPTVARARMARTSSRVSGCGRRAVTSTATRSCTRGRSPSSTRPRMSVMARSPAGIVSSLGWQRASSTFSSSRSIAIASASRPAAPSASRAVSSRRARRTPLLHTRCTLRAAMA